MGFRSRGDDKCEEAALESDMRSAELAPQACANPNREEVQEDDDGLLIEVTLDLARELQSRASAFLDELCAEAGLITEVEVVR